MNDLLKDPNFKAYAKKFPQLIEFVDKLPERFRKTGQTHCDAAGCTRTVTPTTFHVFVTPEPECKGLILCYTCLMFNYYRNGGQKNFTHTRQ